MKSSPTRIKFVEQTNSLHKEPQGTEKHSK